jgi:hypothetical protein
LLDVLEQRSAEVDGKVNALPTPCFAPRGEAQLLAGAKVLEDILCLRGTTPIDPGISPSSVK